MCSWLCPFRILTVTWITPWFAENSLQPKRMHYTKPPCKQCINTTKIQNTTKSVIFTASLEDTYLEEMYSRDVLLSGISSAVLYWKLLGGIGARYWFILKQVWMSLMWPLRISSLHYWVINTKLLWQCISDSVLDTISISHGGIGCITDCWGAEQSH